MRPIIELSICIQSDADGCRYHYTVVSQGTIIVIQGSANDVKTAEARAYLGASEYFLDLFDRTAP